MKNITHQTRGFTLIELMIVMILLSILFAIGVGAFVSTQVKSRDNTRKANLRAIANTLEMYYNDKGQYPQGDGANGQMIACYDTGGSGPFDCTPNSVLRDQNQTIYMPQVPADPVSSLRYYYLPSKVGGSQTYNQYQIYAHLENSQDSMIISPTPNLKCDTNGSVWCNWGISSSNTTP